MFYPFSGMREEEDECSCDSCDSNPVVRKPNIYLYPTENSVISVSLNFPIGGEVVTSIPDYNAGWSFFVDTQGMIDNQYEYLFYESVQPDVWQMEEGWFIQQNELENFFRQNLATYGFYGREIDDFIEYWIPRLTSKNYYAVYPQEAALINSVIELTIIPQPAQKLRLFYVIRGADENDNSIIAPETPADFNRSGFYVTEWGVILK
jgi:hypothetical protein